MSTSPTPDVTLLVVSGVWFWGSPADETFFVPRVQDLATVAKVPDLVYVAGPHRPIRSL